MSLKATDDNGDFVPVTALKIWDGENWRTIGGNIVIPPSIQGMLTRKLSDDITMDETISTLDVSGSLKLFAVPQN